MKSKITLVILLAIILFLGALSFFFGYYYFKTEGEVEELTAIVNQLTQVPEVDEDVVDDTTDTTTQEPEIEKLERITIDTSKVDNSARPYILAIEEQGEFDTFDGIWYRKGPVIKSTISTDITGYQIRYKNQDYIVSSTANIVDIKSQTYANIILLDDGTIKYIKRQPGQELEKIEIKDYDEIKDVVALVSFVTTKTESGKIVDGIGAITSDGVTHILPYEMP